MEQQYTIISFQALKTDFSVNHYVQFKDQNHCCIHELECCNAVSLI